MPISLIMATVGRLQSIHVFLASLERQTSRAFELIVVDQNDDDRLEPILARVREAGMPIQHVKHPTRSVSSARNAGLVLARHEVVAFPDDDCWYDEHVVRQVTESFARDPRLDGLAARWLEASPKPTAPHLLTLKRVRRFRGVPSSIALFLRTSLVRKIGGFDEALGVPGWFGSSEETDLLMRGLAGGAVLRYLPDVIVHHAFGTNDPSADGIQSRRARVRAHGTGALYAKHRLSPYVVLRGLASPLAKMLLPPVRRMMRPRLSVCIAIGRLEGMTRWLYLACRHRRNHR